MSNEIQKTAPPALPLAPEEYKRPFMDQNSNVLRLFFNRLVSTIDAVLDTDAGGKFLYMPYGGFYSTVAQTATGANTGYAVTFNTTNVQQKVDVVNNSRITVDNAGVYLIKASLQLESTNSSTKEVSVWMKKNGTDVAYSAHEYVVAGSGQKEIANWHNIISLTALDYVELFWATDDVNMELHTHAAVAPRPAVASATVAVTFVSNV